MTLSLILAAATEESPSLLATFLSLLPLLIFLLIIWLVSKKLMNKNKGYMERAVEHMERMEQKTDRLIELLEEIKRK